ncbi:MAG: DUF4350 domain-containing protein [Planctomycetota bacterium]|jgi:hypothetical protein
MKEPVGKVGSRFGLKGVIALVVIAGLILAGRLLTSAFGSPIKIDPDVRPGAYSRSALGHEAFVMLLRELGVPAKISRKNSAREAGRGALVLAEPREQGELEDLVEDTYGQVLLVLPKRDGKPDPKVKRWVEKTRLVTTSDAEAPLRELGIEAEVVRTQGTSGWEGIVPIAPALARPQLLEHSVLVSPLVSCNQGVLFGMVQGRSEALYVLSDPDVFSNHGLDNGRNAELAVRIIQAVRDGEGPVVFDEIIHGYDVAPSLARYLLTYPLVLVTFHAALVILLLVWQAGVRFGRADPAPPPFEPGKAYLVGNTAELLHRGGFSADALERYYRSARASVEESLHLSSDLAQADREVILARLERARGVSHTVADLHDQVAEVASHRRLDERRVVKVAKRIHRWQQEMH